MKYHDIPTKWFFYNPTIVSNKNIFYKISKESGVVFYNTKPVSEKFFIKIKPYVFWCKKNKIKFIIPYSFYWANRYKPIGVMIDNKFQKILLKKKNDLQKLKKNFFLVSKIHNFKEAINIKRLIDFIFISPTFETKTHPNQLPISNYIFISLCFFFKEKVIFALGGVNFKNFLSLRCKQF